MAGRIVYFFRIGGGRKNNGVLCANLDRENSINTTIRIDNYVV